MQQGKKIHKGKLSGVLLLLALVIFVIPQASLADNDSAAESARPILIASNEVAEEASSDIALPQEASAVSTVARKITLSEALKMALSNNLTLLQADKDLAGAEIEKQRADYNAKKMQDNVDDFGLRETQDVRMVLDVLPAQTGLTLEITQTQRSFLEDMVRFSTERLYWQVVLTGRTEALSYLSLERARRQLDDTKAMFDVGMAAKIDILQAEVNVQNALVQLNSDRAATKKAKMDLCASLGLPVDTAISPATGMNFTEFKADDKEALCDKLSQANKPLIMQQKAYDIEKLMFDYKATYLEKNTFDYRSAESSLLKAQNTLEDTANKINIAILAAMDNLTVNAANYQAMQKAVSLAQESYRLTMLRYDTGMATLTDVLNAEELLNQAELGSLGALFSYNITMRQIEYNIFALSDDDE